MGVYLRCRKPFMSQEFLYRANLGLVVKHCCRKGMTQDMRTFLLNGCDTGKLAVHHAIYAGIAYPSALRGEEQCPCAVICKG